MSTDAPAPRSSPFARLPVGRSNEVRVLLLAGAVLTAAIVLWTQQLRAAGGNTGGLSPIFFVLFAFLDSKAASLTLGILLVALFVPRWEGFPRLLRWLGAHPWPVAALVAVGFSLGTVYVYRNQPLSMDEFAPYFQSQAFATGQISGRYPLDLLDLLIPPPFQNFFLNTSQATGEVSSNYWPSFALLLTPFTWLGIPWACNPVLSALTIVVLNRVALRLFGTVESAGLVTLFTLASPVFFADGISYYSMTAHMLANGLFLLLVLEPTPKRLFAAGVVGSIALTLHNPVPHALFALPWFVWLLMRERPVPKLAALCAGYLPLSILLGIGWFLHSGHLAHSGGPATDGIGSFSGVAAAFAWPTADLLYARLVALAKLLLWAAPGVLLLAFAGIARTRSDARFFTLACSAVLTFVGYLLVWADQGHGWGFRYFHSAWLVLPLFAAAFVVTPARAAAADSASASASASMSEGPGVPDAEPRADLRAFVCACALLSLVAGTWLRAAQIHAFIGNHLSQMPHYAGTEPRVVVLTGIGFYPHDLVQNDAYLRAGEVRMLDHGDEVVRPAIAKYFPSYRLVYRDKFGQVWSAAAPPAAPAPAPPAR